MPLAKKAAKLWPEVPVKLISVSYTHLDVYKRQAIYTAQHLKVTAIAALTQSGNAAQWLSRADSEMPIYALSPDKYARRKLTLHRGVYPFPIVQGNKNRDEILHEMEQVLLQQRMVNSGDLVLLTFGEPIGSPGGTNTLKIIKIGEKKLN